MMCLSHHMTSIYHIVRIQLPFSQFSTLCYDFRILVKPECMSIQYHFRHDHGSSWLNKWINLKNCDYFLNYFSSLALDSKKKGYFDKWWKIDSRRIPWLKINIYMQFFDKWKKSQYEKKTERNGFLLVNSREIVQCPICQ